MNKTKEKKLFQGWKISKEEKAELVNALLDYYHAKENKRLIEYNRETKINLGFSWVCTPDKTIKDLNEFFTEQLNENALRINNNVDTINKIIKKETALRNKSIGGKNDK